MSRIFKSDYVQIGAPKPIKNSFAHIIKRAEPEHKDTPVEKSAEDIRAEKEHEANQIIDDAKEMYLRIIEEANYEARSITEKAQQEAQTVLAAAREEGFNEGYQSGFRKGLDDSQDIIEAAMEAKEYIEQRKSEIYEEAEEKIIELVLGISRKVIGDELKQNREAIFSVIKLALDKCAYKSRLILRVSEEDYDFVSENKDILIRLTEGLSELDIIKDISMQKGGCIVETTSGEINSSVDIQIKELEKAFNYVLRNE
ncbi:MAG: FliH/SctL family protein [Bacillota bacterium]